MQTTAEHTKIQFTSTMHLFICVSAPIYYLYGCLSYKYLAENNNNKNQCTSLDSLYPNAGLH